MAGYLLIKLNSSQAEKPKQIRLKMSGYRIRFFRSLSLTICLWIWNALLYRCLYEVLAFTLAKIIMTVCLLLLPIIEITIMCCKNWVNFHSREMHIAKIWVVNWHLLHAVETEMSTVFAASKQVNTRLLLNSRKMFPNYLWQLIALLALCMSRLQKQFLIDWKFGNVYNRISTDNYYRRTTF